MSAKKKAKQAEAVSVTPLTIEADVTDGALYFRTEMATGRVEHEGVAYSIEASALVSGAAVLVQLKPAGGTWRTYVLPVDRLMRAAFDEYLRTGRTPSPAPGGGA